jgi:hypothetical protein
MNSRRAQDVILRLLADGPFRAAALENGATAAPDVAAVLAKVDLAALDRFGRFLCRHYYRERIVHYFKYARALVFLTGRAPEAALKTPEFKELVPRLTLGNGSSARAVLELLERFLTHDAAPLRAAVPYWDDLVAYQGAFFRSDALPPPPGARSAIDESQLAAAAAGVRPEAVHRFPARAETAIILELTWDLPGVLPSLLRPFQELPRPARRPTRLLFARSPRGEVTALRCTDKLKHLLESLTGAEIPAQVAARMGLDAESFDKTLRQLEELGAVIAQESFSSSHVGSDFPLGVSTAEIS